jgi:hypothetical protein
MYEIVNRNEARDLKQNVRVVFLTVCARSLNARVIMAFNFIAIS